MSATRLDITVLTACTGVKAPAPVAPLTQEDFRRGPEHVAELHQRSTASLVPAEALYRGQHHLRLMRGVDAARGAGHHVSVAIVSAGYGLLRGDAAVLPYDCTFQGMSARERRQWAGHLGLPTAVKGMLKRRAHTAIVALGDDYLDACGLPADLELGAPTLVFCGAGTALRLERVPSVRPVVLHKSDTRRFGCGLVGLKGEVAGRLMARMAAEPRFLERIERAELLDKLAASPSCAAHIEAAA